MSTLDNMNDMEKNRVDYVQRMEATVEHLTKEYQRYKTLAETWEPKITVKMDAKQELVTVGLQFGGKYVHATITFNHLQNSDLTSVVTSVSDALVESLVDAQLRQLISPELEKAMKSAKSVKGAGTW